MGVKNIYQPPSIDADVESNIPFGERTQKDLRNDSLDISLSSLSRRLSNPPSSTRSDFAEAKTIAQDNEPEWHESFKTHFNKSELRKESANSRSPYITVALITCAVSGSAFFFLLRSYAVLDATKGDQSAFERAATYANINSTAGLKLNDAQTAEFPVEDEPSAFTANPATPLVPRSAATAGAERNQGLSAENAASNPAELTNNYSPASQTSKTSVPALVSVPAETSPAPLQKSDTKTAALTPPVGAAQAKIEFPNAQDAKPATNEHSDSSIAVPDIHLPALPPEQEEKMLKRASDLMNENDIAGARMVYRYLADRGSPSGALALAESYDPNKWARHHIAGMAPDASQAQAWYRRAAALGSKEAAAILRDGKP